MPASLAFRLSGGAGNTNPAASLGGVMSTTAAAANTLFDTVTAGEASVGDIEYRCFFLLNDGDTALTNLRLWVSDTPAQGTIGLALDGNGKNADAEVESDEGTAPTGEIFEDGATAIGDAIAVPDLAPGERHAVRVRRFIAGATPGVSLASNALEFRVDYEYIP
jgi:hypothetical protein